MNTPPEKKSKSKILFIGNSLTYVHGGLDHHLSKLVASSTLAKPIQTDSYTQGGATLELHFHGEKALDTIHAKSYDFVVLQDDLPEYEAKTLTPFFKYARLFDQEIIRSGAQTVLLMTWPYQRLDWINLNQIEQAHQQASTELNARIAPVGRAFVIANAERPDLPMLSLDQEHESIYGAYLAACTLYASIYNESPEGLTYGPKRVSVEDAKYLQKIAWKTVQDWLKAL